MTDESLTRRVQPSAFDDEAWTRCNEGRGVPDETPISRDQVFDWYGGLRVALIVLTIFWIAFGINWTLNNWPRVVAALAGVL